MKKNDLYSTDRGGKTMKKLIGTSLLAIIIGLSSAGAGLAASSMEASEITNNQTGVISATKNIDLKSKLKINTVKKFKSIRGGDIFEGC